MLYCKNMKIPITDKFLWFLYDCIESLDKMHHDLAQSRSMYEVVYPDSANLRRAYETEKSRRQFGQFVRYLQERGYIKTKALEGTDGIMITRKGAEKALRAKWKLKEKTRRKDGKWIMMIFDIPENKRRLRNFLRFALIDMGYQQLQKSVWVCPYDTYKETEEIIIRLRVAPYVRLFLIKEL